jgi:hypothetical protein
MKCVNIFNITGAYAGAVAFGKGFQVFGNIELFRGAQYQVYPVNSSYFRWFQLGIAAGNYHHAFGGPALNAPYELPAFLVGVVGNGAGIDHIHVGLLLELSFFEALVFQQPGHGRRF